MAEAVERTTKTKHYQPPITERPKVVLPEPRNVSPLIKFSRYGLLAAGIVYGFWRFNYLEKKEMAIQERELPIKHLREKRKEERRVIAVHEEMIQLAKETGVTPKEDAVAAVSK